MDQLEQDKKEAKFWRNIFLWFVAFVIILSVIGYVVKKGREATHLDDAVATYEEYQSIYNTCVRINQDICNMKELPEEDVMFQQFSKTQRVNTLRTQLNRWIEEYNAKSEMFGRALWKSDKLPYQLSNSEFNCNSKN